MTDSAVPVRAHHKFLLLTLVLVIAYLCVGIALPVVPFFISQQLGLDSTLAGLGAGSAFIATILTRGYAGKLSDQRGPKAALVRGLIAYGAGSLIAMSAVSLADQPMLAYSAILLGRAVLGLGESLVTVSIVAWSIGTVGPQNTGKVLALVGAALYGTLAAGAPLGLWLFDKLGFAGCMLVCTLLPLVALIITLPLSGIAAHPDAKRPSFLGIMGSIWQQGAVVLLQGIGFALIGAFFALYFREQQWSMAGLGIAAFGAGFVLVRGLFGHLLDKTSPLKIAFISLLVETLGQSLIWQTHTPPLALLGAFMTGLGCSLIFPAMGRQVVHQVPAHLRATALGGFSACQDLAYGLSAPVVGLLVDHAGYQSAYMVGALSAATGCLLVMVLRLRRPVSAVTV